MPAAVRLVPKTSQTPPALIVDGFDWNPLWLTRVPDEVNSRALAWTLFAPTGRFRGMMSVSAWA
ncbi:hypothetical protein GCM10023113_11110 [Cellulomonas oligotrophica]|uniref:Uncharacterized protein n=1 Tax=Cellulomonas oligotrophica TaxID=931536 RepID=A0ABQ4D7W6_9CELL|nr:hypothetical protein Col01nite_09580 [Cellulomonas oligotrophica]